MIVSKQNLKEIMRLTLINILNSRGIIYKHYKNREGNKMKCLNCNSSEGTLLKEFDNEQSYSWYDLSEMTEVCASCGSENIKIEMEVA